MSNNDIKRLNEVNVFVSEIKGLYDLDVTTIGELKEITFTDFKVAMIDKSLELVKSYRRREKSLEDVQKIDGFLKICNNLSDKIIMYNNMLKMTVPKNEVIYENDLFNLLSFNFNRYVS